MSFHANADFTTASAQATHAYAFMMNMHTLVCWYFLFSRIERLISEFKSNIC